MILYQDLFSVSLKSCVQSVLHPCTQLESQLSHSQNTFKPFMTLFLFVFSEAMSHKEKLSVPAQTRVYLWPAQTRTLIPFLSAKTWQVIHVEYTVTLSQSTPCNLSLTVHVLFNYFPVRQTSYWITRMTINNKHVGSLLPLTINHTPLLLVNTLICGNW